MDAATTSATTDSTGGTDHPAPRPELQRTRVGAATIVTLDGSVHLALTQEEVRVLDSLDGSTPVTATLACKGVDTAELVDDLAQAGFLVGSAAFQEPRLAVSRHGLEFSGFDRLVAGIDQAIGDLLSRRITIIAAIITSLAGLAVLLRSMPDSAGYTPATTLAVLAGWTVVSAIPHEVAHAWVLHRGGRRVGRAGFGLHWGAVAFFVDATDALFLPRRARLAQTVAGPFADAVIAGGLGVVGWLLGPGALATLLLQMAVINWISVLINLSPVLELDGQHALEDLLDEPDLHGASLDAIRKFCRERDPRTRLLALYGLVAIAVGAAAVALSTLVWTTYYLPLLQQSWGEGLFGRLSAIAFAGPTLAALVAWLAHRAMTIRPTVRKEVIEP